MSGNIKKALTDIVTPENISDRITDLETHAKDRSFHKAVNPDIVVYPTSTKQVSKILKLANEQNIPVTAWGGGSSLEGHSIPVKGGIVVDMTKMNSILNLYKNDLQVTVQPGIVGDDLNKYLQKSGLFFPAFPGSSYIATIGGMITTNAGSMYAVKYGVVKDWVLKLEVVLANGDIMTVGSRSFKSVSGYDLKSLFIGSQGTLGIITEATLKLTAIPENKIAVMVSFNKISEATKTTLALLNSDVEPAAIEFMDQTYMQYVNQAKASTLPELQTLIIELHGNESINKARLKTVESICKKQNVINITPFITAEENKLLWEYRRAVRPALHKLFPNMGVLSAEIGLPLSQMENFLEKAGTVSKKYGLQTIMFGHMGDGNFHGWALYELDNPVSHEKVTQLNDELIKFAIAVGGTTTGEHGIGIGKRKFLPLEHPSSISLMKEIKKLLDPNGILNPGKMFP